MSMKENDAATVLSQMSQLVCPSSFDLSSLGIASPEHDSILDADAIGATCTLQSSSFRNDFFSSLSCDSSFDGSRNMTSDPYIGFDDAEHPYAASSTAVLTKPKNIHTPKNSTSLTCSLCDKTFKTRQAITVHLHFHANQRSHKCSTCSKAFTTKSDLKRHYKVHDKASLFKCDDCSATFRDQATKTRHLKKHQKDVLFTCDSCDKEFNRVDSYKEHLNTHLTHKQYQCHICSKEFNYKSSFNRHVISHQNNATCELCGKNFSREDYLKLHQEKIHNNDVISKQKTKSIKGKRNKDATKTTGITKNKSNRKQVKTKIKRSVSTKVNRKKKIKNNSNDEESPNENLNAIPILTSMAENAANKNYSINKHRDEDPEFGNSPIDIISIHSPSQFDSDFIDLLNESSTEDDCESIISEMEDDLMTISDEERLYNSSPVSRVSCIVSNPSNTS